MNRYFCRDNVVSTGMTAMDPWDFDVSGVDFDMPKRDYKKKYFNDPRSKHCLFSMIEATLPGQAVKTGGRPEDQNPPAVVYGFVADLEHTVGDNVVEAMMRKPAGEYLPTRWAITQGDNVRLVWEFESGIRVESAEHVEALLNEVANRVSAANWGGVLDRKASCSSTQCFDVGKAWGIFSGRRIAKEVVQLWDYQVFTKMRTQTKTTYNIPFDVVAKEAKERFGEAIRFPFAEGQRCQRFWDPQSDNMDGCVITKDGVRVFVPHDKPFMSWADIFGLKFADQYAAAKISPIVNQVWYNNRGGEFIRWKDSEKCFVPRDLGTMRRDLIAEAGLDPKCKKGELQSELETALHDITTRREVLYAAPFLFFPHGPMRHPATGDKVINTCVKRALAPVAPYLPEGERWTWDNQHVREAFPFIHGLISTLFELDGAKAMNRLDHDFTEDLPSTDDNVQLKVFLTWLGAFYKGALELKPTQGQCMVMAGPSGVGKTFLVRHVIGGLLGGYYGDAQDYYVSGSKFNGALLESPIHLIDDVIADLDQKSRTQFVTRLKVVVATASLRYEEKYRNSVPAVPWFGRVIISCNMDPRSLQILPDLEQSNADKISMIKVSGTKYRFYGNAEAHKNAEIVRNELPRFARFLLEYFARERDEQISDLRMGVKAYQHPDMKVAAAANGYGDVVVDALRELLDRTGTKDSTGKVKFDTTGAANVVGTARRIFDLIDGVSSAAARDIGGARGLGTQLQNLVRRGFNIHMKREGGTWIYTIPYDFNVINGGETKPEGVL